MITIQSPNAFPVSVSSTSKQILPSNPARRSLIFFNQSPTTIFICPAVTPSQTPLPAVVNGPGCIAIAPNAMLSLPQQNWPETIGLGSAWNGIVLAPNAALTIWEFGAAAISKLVAPPPPAAGIHTLPLGMP